MQGSLRDLIHRCKNPKNGYARKYVGTKPRGVDPRLIPLLGRQILEVCVFVCVCVSVSVSVCLCLRLLVFALHSRCLMLCSPPLPLQALKFLHERNIPFGHLHSGNVIMVSDTLCRLSDIENGVLNLPSRLKNNFVQLKRLQVR